MPQKRHGAGAGKGRDGKGQGGQFRKAERAGDVTPGTTLTLDSQQQVELPQDTRSQSSHEHIKNAAYEFALLAENPAANIPSMVHKASERQIMGQTPSWGEPDTQERACVSIRESAHKVLAMHQMKRGRDVPQSLLETAKARLHTTPDPEDAYQEPTQAQWNEVIASHSASLLAASHVGGDPDMFREHHRGLAEAGEAQPATESDAVPS